MSERLCVVMPVYNEEEAIGAVLRKWSDALIALGIDFTIRPYNDGSKDSSLKVMRDFVAANPDSHVDVKDKPNGGHGNTILTGYREAAADGFDWIFQIDSDDEMGPEKFNELWSRRADYDFLVGIRDGRIQALPRKIISFVSRCCVKTFYGRKTIWDVNTPYRLMRASVFAPIYNAIPLTTFAPNVILSGMVARRGLRFFEMRVPQHDRTTGEVSIKKWKLFKAAARSFLQTICFSFQGGNAMGGSFFVIFSLLLLAVLGLLSNPFVSYMGTDGAVFAHIGNILTDGIIPYRDVFDHKGPVIYLLNFIGFSTGLGFSGVWVVESLLLTASAFFTYRKIKMELCTASAVAGTATFLATFAFCSNGGNMTETYAAVFLVIPLVDLLFTNNEIRVDRFKCVCVSSLACCVLLLRLNLSLGFAVFGIYYVYRSISDKNIGDFIEYFLFSILGVAIVAVPILAFLEFHGAMKDFYDCYWVFNLKYTRANFMLNWKTLLALTVAAGCLLLPFFVRNSNRKRGALLNGLYAVFAAFGVILKADGWHYFMPLVVATVYPVSLFIFYTRRRKSVLAFILSVAIIVLVARVFRCAFVRDSTGNLELRGRREQCELKEFKDFISKGGGLMSVGNDCMVYFVLKRNTKSRYPYQWPIRSMSEKINCEYKENIAQGVDEWAVVSKIHAISALQELEKNYTIVKETPSYLLLQYKHSRE